MAAAFWFTKSASVLVPLKLRSGVSLTVVSSKNPVVGESTNPRSSHREKLDSAISLVRSSARALPLTLPGAAPRSAKRLVMLSSAALYASDGNGNEESACQRLAQSRTSCWVCAGKMYSTMTVKDGQTQVSAGATVGPWEEIEQVNLEKQHQLTKAAKLYLTRYGFPQPPARFDVVAVVWPNGSRACPAVPGGFWVVS